MALGWASRVGGGRISPETAAQVRVWSRVMGTGLGIGALAGAGQLGVGYGLGLVRLAREFPNDGGWSAQLTWVAWFAAVAVLAGAAGGAWAVRRNGLRLGLGARVAAGVVAGVGAAVVVPLAALPADSATVAGRAEPATAAAVTAGLGVLVGVVTAVTALTVRLVAVSVTLLVAVVWLLAVVSVLGWLLPTGDLPEVRLAVLDLPAVGGGNRSTVAVAGVPVLALLICGAVAGAARSRGLAPLPTAVASTAAPGFLALIYLLGSPGTGDRAVQTAPYAASLIGVAVGLLASLVVGVVRMPAPRTAEPAAPDWAAPTDSGAPESGATESGATEEFGGLAEFDQPEEPAPDLDLDLDLDLEREPSEPATTRIEPPAWARFDPPPEPDVAADSPVSVPPAWPAPAQRPEPEPEPGPSQDPFLRLEPPSPPAEPVAPPPFRFEQSVAAPDPADPAADAEIAQPDATETKRSEPSEPPEPSESKPARRLRFPRLRRAPRQQTEEAPQLETAEEVSAPGDTGPRELPEPVEAPEAQVEEAAASAPPKPVRPDEAEHLDWISSLAGGPEDEDEPDTGRRRLRWNRDLGVSADDLPDPPVRRQP